jgi:hypothetical protein
MSARSQLQSKPVADLRSIAESLGIEHKGLQKAKLIDLLVEHSDEILDTEMVFLIFFQRVMAFCVAMVISQVKTMFMLQQDS